jgi:hypothetical protein
MQSNMKGKIIDRPYSSDTAMDTWLKAHAGQWVEIETEHLFTDQYNVERYRLYDTHFSAIQDDARAGKGKCQYCGKLISVSDVICMAHADCPSHGIEWFNERTCFFLANPNGIEQPDKFEPIHIGTYTLENSYSGTHYRLANLKKTINFKFDGQRFWVISVGYDRVKFLDIPYEVQRKLILKLKELQPVT